MAELLLERGVYVIGFSYPVVPQGAARIRVQLSAAHSTDDVNRAVDAFVDARAALSEQDPPEARDRTVRASGDPGSPARPRAWTSHGPGTIGRMIEARRLRILRAVADHRTVTAAAAALYLTPSAVSQQLAALEQETGHRLVDRSARGVRLTPAGEILLSHTNAVLAQLERAEAELAAYSSGGRPARSRSPPSPPASAWSLAPAMARLALTAPGIRIRVQDAEGDASLPMVLDRQVGRRGRRRVPGRARRGRPPADPRTAVRGAVRRGAVPVGHRLADADRGAARRPGRRTRGSARTPATRATTWWSWPASSPASSPGSSTPRTTSARWWRWPAAGAGVALVPRSALRGMDLSGVVVRPVEGAHRPAGSSRRYGTGRRTTR